MSDITLTASSRNALLSLSNTADMMVRNQSRLSTGLKVSSAVDDAVSYFQAKSLNNRASDFTARKDQIDQGISALGAAINGTTSIDGMLKQMKGIVNSAATADSATRDTLKSQYNDLLKQIDKTAEDSSYNGINLLAGGDAKLTVQFSDVESAKLTVQSKKLDTSKESLNLQEITGFGSTAEDLKTMSTKLDTAINTVRARAAELGGNSTFLQTRMDFTKNYINTMQEGANKLTLADLNSEGANLAALQTRQQIGVQSLEPRRTTATGHPVAVALTGYSVHMNRAAALRAYAQVSLIARDPRELEAGGLG